MRYVGIAAVVLAACFSPDYTSGLPCSKTGRCPPGQRCDELTNLCEVDECPRVALDLEPIIPTVVLLIDQSGSMEADFNGKTRWDAVRDALTNSTDGVVTLLENRVRFGATLYTSNSGDAGGICPMLITEPAGFGKAGAIRDLMTPPPAGTGYGPFGDTPTGESLDAVALDLQANPPPSSPPIIVLATDGEPDTCAEPNPQTGQPESVAAAMAAYAAGIDVFILSVGTEVTAGHLQDMANAGAGLPVGGAVNAPFFVANNQSEMIDAFNQIITGARSCTLTLSEEIDVSKAGEGTVTIDTGSGVQTLVFGQDWDVVDSMTIELIGRACDDLLSFDTVSLSATFPCAVIAFVDTTEWLPMAGDANRASA